MGVTIQPIDTSDKKSLEAFLHFPWKIYCTPDGTRKDPHWVPPFLPEYRDLLNKSKNPFFQHAETQCFLALDEKGEIVGRIAATVDKNHNEFHKEKTGWFGLYECANRQEVADILLETAQGWVRSRGMETLRGPANLSSNDDWGFLLEGFNSPPGVMMPHNPPYYVKQAEKWGLVKIKELYSWFLCSLLPAPERVERIAEYARKKFKIRIRHLDMRHFDRDLAIVKKIYNTAWADNWGFVPMTNAEFDYLSKKLRPMVWPHFVHFAEVEGETAAVNIMLPNYNQILIHMNGEQDLKGMIQFLRYRRRINIVREIIMGILPEYQNKGLSAVLHMEAMKSSRENGIWLGDLSWTLEDNHRINADIQAMGSVKYKTYGIFEKTGL
jgi:GNAT superfamily N-acetyltransferase